MLGIALPFAVGIALGQQLPALPGAYLTALLPVVGLLAWSDRRGRALALLVAGVLWSAWHGHLAVGARLPPELDRGTAEVVGWIAAPPRRQRERITLEIDVAKIRPSALRRLVGRRIRVHWYSAPTLPQPGERWRLAVKLRRPHGPLNPGGFDYERWLLERHIAAVGYVRDAARMIGGARAAPIARARIRLAAAITGALGDRPATALVRGLAVGMRGEITAAQWEVLRATGTAHLMAISGLHVGLVAGFGVWIGGLLWRLGAGLSRRVPAACAASVPGLALAVGYAALAGFSLPTQRALIMIAVVLAARALRVRPGFADTLSLALAIVLALDPLAVLSAGTWLSFGAVAVLASTHGARPRAVAARRLPALARAQCLIAVGMIPATVLWFGRIAWCAPLANLIAVPWTALAVIPATLAGTALVTGWPAAGSVLLGGAATALDMLWWILERLASWPGGATAVAAPAAGGIAAAAVAVALLALPPGAPGRWLLWAWLLPVVMPASRAPGAGDYRVTVLDVGHGLAAVVRTARHALLFDAGPRRGRGFDAGARIVVPYLAAVGLRRVDRMILSHADSDHAGGAAAIMRAVPVERVLGGLGVGTERCRAGQRWTWDGIRFEILHPLRPRAGNDGSCVLRVKGAGGVALMTGDIEEAAEDALRARTAAGLAADLIVAPHHGSRTSSSTAFVDRVHPSIAVFSAAYHDRFGAPSPQVVDRYRSLGASTITTGDAGAVRADFDSRSRTVVVRGYRAMHPRYWRRPNDRGRHR